MSNNQKHNQNQEMHIANPDSEFVKSILSTKRQYEEITSSKTDPALILKLKEGSR